MSKLTKKLASATSKQLKLEHVMSPGATKASKSRSASSLDESGCENGSPAPKKMIISETSSGTESDAGASLKTAKVVQPLFTSNNKGASATTGAVSVKTESKSQSASVSAGSSTTTTGVLVDEIRKKRLNLYESVAAFRFNKKRVRVLSEATQIPENTNGLVYWMSRDQRVQGLINKLDDLNKYNNFIR